MKTRKYLLTYALTFLLGFSNAYAKGGGLKINETQELSFGLVSVGNGGTISTAGSFSGDVDMFGENQHGIFEVTGSKNRDVEISFVGAADLKQKGYKIRDVDYQVIDGNIINLGSSGKASIVIIGQVYVNAAQQQGLYTDSYKVKASYK
jgi:hypothetical protein